MLYKIKMMKNQVKYLQDLFYNLLNDYGKVFMVVRYSENSTIGNRGFTDEEKKNGIILVFNSRNFKNLQWTEEGSIITSLGFGVNNKLEKCFLHFDDIVSVFSPDAMIRFERWDMWNMQDNPRESKPITAPEKEKLPSEKIISLDSVRKTKA
jgi:hypothetical protein